MSEIDPKTCNHLLYPVRILQTLSFSHFECNLCFKVFSQHELQAEFKRLNDEREAYAQERVEAERVRIDKALVKKRDFFNNEIEGGKRTDAEVNDFNSKVSAIAYIRDIVGGYPKVTKAQIDMVIDLLTRKPPTITSFNGVFNLSDDLHLYDGQRHKYIGHAMYRWEGEDDEKQVASWENFRGWWIADDDDNATLSDSIVLWLPIEEDEA